MNTGIGDVFYDSSTDRYATVIEISNEKSSPTAILQYDDGEPSTESVDNLKSNFLYLPSPPHSRSPPILSDACIEGRHVFDGYSRDVVLEREDVEYSCKCHLCGLSTSSLQKFLGHSIAASVGDVCHKCHEDIDSIDNANMDVENRLVCSECWKDYHDVWKMTYQRLEDDYAFYDPVCGWFSDEIPENGRKCPSCGEEQVTVLSKDSPTYENFCEQETDR